MSEAMRVPVTLVTGYLGAGKTTLLRHIISSIGKIGEPNAGDERDSPQKDLRLAIVMNEFGRIAIDGKVVEGKGIRVAELSGGCVCCSMSGEFQAAMEELISLTKPDWIVVETTGLAEPSTLAHDISENMPNVRLDSIVTVVDADALVKSPSIGHTGMEQIELADLLLLNKMDLVPKKTLHDIREGLSRVNPRAMIIETTDCVLDASLIFGMERRNGGKILKGKLNPHEPDLDCFDFTSDAKLDHDGFLRFLENMPKGIYRSKGFVKTGKGEFLMNYVSGRSSMEQFACDRTALVFIGKGILGLEKTIRTKLEALRSI